jgi:hypothetical protein
MEQPGVVARTGAKRFHGQGAATAAPEESEQHRSQHCFSRSGVRARDKKNFIHDIIAEMDLSNMGGILQVVFKSSWFHGRYLHDNPTNLQAESLRFTQHRSHDRFPP